jgi:hypothetical protein
MKIPHGQSRENYGPKAAAYLTILGWVNLFGLNLDGLIWLWIASHLREQSNRFRKAAIVLLCFHVALLAAVAAKTLLDPSTMPSLRVLGIAIHIDSVIIVPVAMIFMAAFAVPLAWLLAPGTRAAFQRRVERGLCVNCGYDLRASQERCPECGEPIPKGVP